MKLVCLIIIIAAIPFASNGQNTGIGADVMYNFQTESFGAGVRVSVLPNNSLSFVPQFSYYPGFNKIHEYYLGLGMEYKFLRLRTFTFYLIGHGAYNSWINHASSVMEGAQQNNWNLEGGIGVTTNRCLRPFSEYRYNIKFLETHLRLGLLYIFNCSDKNGGNKGRRKKDSCPVYN